MSSTHRARRGNTASATSATGMRLSAEDQELMERFSKAGDGPSPSNIRVEDQAQAAGGPAAGPGLNARQLTEVVGRNRPSLRRCYETAVRGMGNAPTVRMDVDITVGMSGGVTRVQARGSDLGSLGACVESAVRRWRFPSSGNTSQMSFPVVFQPGT